MAKSSIRFGMAMIAGVLIATAAAQSRADQTTGQLARELRWALGFDAMDMAALGIGDESYQTIVTNAVTYCQSNLQEVQAQLATLRQARATLQQAYEVNDGREASEQAIAAAATEVNSAVSSIQQAFASLTTTLHSQLTPTAQDLQTRIASHRLLDPFTAALDLEPSQLTSINSAQHLRDRTRLHCNHRALPSIVHVAEVDHESTVEGILNEGQRQARDGHIASTNEKVLGFSQIDEQHS